LCTYQVDEDGDVDGIGAVAPVGPVMSDLGSTQGALLIGTAVANVLFGVSCLQTCFYAVHYGDDPWIVKALVAAVFVADLMHQLMCWHTGKITISLAASEPN
jgi:quinol-cytochrome oxidoreductase complex cytochrome b subunit